MPGIWPGGSSGGSAAALYYDDIDVTVGADQGGSIRIPASWCGVVGLKPTHGLVPYTGIGGVDQTLDHIGPPARSVTEVAQALDAIAGKDPMDPRQHDVPAQSYAAALGRGVRGMRIGVLKEGFGQEGAEQDVEEAARAAVEVLGALGALVTEVSVPAHRTAPCIIWGLFPEGMTALLQGNGMGYHWRGTYDPALADAMGACLRAHGQDLPPQVKVLATLGTYLREHYHGRFYAKAQNLRAGLRTSYDESLRHVDILAMPTLPMKAPEHRRGLGVQELVTRGWSMMANVAPFNATGHPSITVPCAKSNGLPVGLMLTGRHFDDATVLAAAHAFEQAVSWESR